MSLGRTNAGIEALASETAETEATLGALVLAERPSDVGESAARFAKAFPDRAVMATAKLHLLSEIDDAPGIVRYQRALAIVLKALERTATNE